MYKRCIRGVAVSVNRRPLFCPLNRCSYSWNWNWNSKEHATVFSVSPIRNLFRLVFFKILVPRVEETMLTILQRHLDS